MFRIIGHSVGLVGSFWRVAQASAAPGMCCGRYAGEYDVGVGVPQTCSHMWEDGLGGCRNPQHSAEGRSVPRGEAPSPELVEGRRTTNSTRVTREIGSATGNRTRVLRLRISKSHLPIQ